MILLCVSLEMGTVARSRSPFVVKIEIVGTIKNYYITKTGLKCHTIS